jgi:hypothetical protein
LNVTTGAATNVTGYSDGTYVAGKTDIFVVVEAEKYIYSKVNTSPALTLVGGTVGDTVTLINNGYILGKGGDGGGSKQLSTGVPSQYAPLPGGTALKLGFNTTVVNSAGAFICGGGGGGGGTAENRGVVGGGGGAGGGAGGDTYNQSSGAAVAGGYGGVVEIVDGVSYGRSGGAGSVDPNRSYADSYLYQASGGGGGRVNEGNTFIGGAARSSQTGGAFPSQSFGGGANAGLGGGGGGSGGVKNTGSGGNTYGEAGGGGGGWGQTGGTGEYRYREFSEALSVSGSGGTIGVGGNATGGGTLFRSQAGAIGGKAIDFNGKTCVITGDGKIRGKQS